MTPPRPEDLLADLLRAGPVAAPAGFADRAVAAVTRDRRVRQRRAWAARATVAAGLLVAAGFAAEGLRPRDRVEVVTTTLTPPAPAPEPAVSPFGEAREALASVAERAGDAALAPTRNLLAARPEPAETPPPPAETPAVTVAVLDPLTDTTRRAVSSFLRDVRQFTAVSTATEGPTR